MKGADTTWKIWDELCFGGYSGAPPLVSPDHEGLQETVDPYIEKVQALFGRKFADELWMPLSTISEQEQREMFREGFRLGMRLTLDLTGFK